MAKAVIKTTENAKSVEAFIDAQAEEQVRKDCRVLVKIMQKATGEPPNVGHLHRRLW